MSNERLSNTGGQVAPIGGYNPNRPPPPNFEKPYMPRIVYDNGLEVPGRWQILRESLQFSFDFNFFPFGEIKRPIYNTTQIKKIYDLFPSSIKRVQLSSNELVNLLRSQIFDKDITIDELRRQIAELSQFSEQTLDEQLANLGFDDVNDLIQQFAGNALDLADDASLSAEGFTQVGSSNLYVNVESRPSFDYPFQIWHSDENSASKGIFPDAQLESPTSITFRNVGDTPVHFIKQENWTSDEKGRINTVDTDTGLDDTNTRFDGSPYNPTNAFKFDKFINAHKTSYVIQPNSEVRTTLKLGYNTKDAYDEAGLRRGRAGLFGGKGKPENTWYGDMMIYASDTSGTLRTIKAKNNVLSLGSMRLYRDPN